MSQAPPPPPQMSTPITNIPIDKEPTKIEEDPEVSAILKEMQQPTVIHQAPHVIQSQQQQQQQPQQQQQQVYKNQQAIVSIQKRPYLDYDILYKAIYALAIAYVVFYPEIGFVYSKFPILDKIKTYEFIIRVLLFGVIIYGIMWKFF